MTCENSHQIENRIIAAMRQQKQLRVNLSADEKIDLCGIHLLGVLQNFGADAARIVATSVTVDAALRCLPSTHRHAKLKRHIKIPAHTLTGSALAAA